MAVAFSQAVNGAEKWLSPNALAATRDGTTLFVACGTGDQVLTFDIKAGKVIRTIPVPAAPSGLALSPDESTLYVTCAAQGQVCAVDPATGKIRARMQAGHAPMAPVLETDGKMLFVCNRFDNDVSFLDLMSQREVRRVKVQREPVAAALTKDGRHLLVANQLHNGRADADYVAAVVSVIDVAAGQVTRELRLPNGSGILKGVAVSPDGKYAVITHVLSRFHLPTTQLDRGWMNTSAGTIVDVEKMEVVNTVLLDNVDSGAADPWGVAWSGDGQTVAVAHSGTHEVSLIDFPGLMKKLSALPVKLEDARNIDPNAASKIQEDVPNDLSFLVGLRRRLKLPETDRGPRALAVTGSKVWVGNYFSDTLAVVDFSAANLRWQSISLGPKPEMTEVRRGEMYFHDAGICFQGWQSCATCHPSDARADALNWDLLNDGIGNPKNTKSLLWSHRTPPAMSMGVRDSAEVAVRSGIRYILFTVQPEEVAKSIDAYLKSLEPAPSPFLEKGKLSKAAARGKKVFTKAGCAECHPAGLFTDLNHYDVGTASLPARQETVFDTPTLVELWRTGPYLHDGSAATLKDVVTVRNPKDQHGKTSKLTPAQVDDLCAYLLSL